MKWIVFLFIMGSLGAHASLESCFQEMKTADSFPPFIIKTHNDDFQPSPVYSDLVISAYANTITWLPDLRRKEDHRERPFILLHLEEEFFQKAVAILHSGDFSQSPETVNLESAPATSFRMYVNYSYNDFCNQDFIFIKEHPYMDKGFLYLLSHEIFHLLRKQHCPDCENRLWLEEGMADFVASKIARLLPNLSLRAYGKMENPISLFETRASHFSIEHYAQSFLLFLHLFNRDRSLPEHLPLLNKLKEVARKNLNDCDFLRSVYKTTTTNEEELSCKDWLRVFYKEFVLSIIDDTMARGFHPIPNLGNFKKEGVLPPNYSFVMFDITQESKAHQTPQVLITTSAEALFVIKTYQFETYHVASEDLAETLAGIPEESFLRANLILLNYESEPAPYHISY